MVSLPNLHELVDLAAEDLMARLKIDLSDERTAVARTIAYLAEVDRRGLYAADACSSLHDFCVRRLALSEDSAYRRANAARLVKRFPTILRRIQSGAMHLSGLWTLRHFLNEGNVESVLDELQFKSKRQIENFLAERCPRPDVSPSITSMRDSERTAIEQLSPERVRFEFTGSSELRSLVESAVSMMRHRNPSGDVGVVFEEAMVLLVASLERERFAKTEHPKSPAAAIDDGGKIQAAVRRAVFNREGEACTFENAKGERCGSRDFIELDHIKPKAKGGGNGAENLRVRCRTHNRFEAEKVFGREHVKKKIAERKQRRPVPGQSPAKSKKRKRHPRPQRGEPKPPGG